MIKYIILSLLLSGCVTQEQQSSQIMHEKGVVLNKIFTPSKHENNITLPLINLVGDNKSGIGIGFDGNIGVNLGGIMITDNHVREQYEILFKCDHGNFTVQGPQYRPLYEKLNENDNVIISYKEIYLRTYESETDSTIKLDLLKYDFLDAKVLVP